MAAPVSVAVPSMDRLHGPENYASWAVRMRSKLNAAGLWDAVSPPPPVPGAPAVPVPDNTVNKALDLIMQHVGDTVLSEISSATTAKAAWDALESSYAAATQARRMNLLKSLTELKKHRDEGIQTFISRAKNLAADIMLVKRSATTHLACFPDA